MKGPAEKNFEGIYANPRFMHAAGIIVGCIVHVQVKSGSLYEGVLRTFSSKADFVLEMARKIDNKKNPNNHGALSNATLTTLPNPDEVIDKLVFRFADVITMTASNVDPDYATRETFTDTGISKFNGQVHERELEPWDEGVLSTDGLPDLGGAEEEANGWDPNDMFRTNEEKYGVKSSFDSNLPGYTIPLTKQNTEEYKQQEAKASKIAQEIESGFLHKSRLALENGEEEDRFSAVVRPDNTNNFRTIPHRTRKPPNIRNIRSSPAPSGHHGNRNNHQHSHVFHRVSSPAVAMNNSQGNYKSVTSTTISPRPTPTSTPTPRLAAVPPNQLPLQQVTPQFQHVPVTSTAICTTPPAAYASPPVSQGEDSHKVNGEAEKVELKFTPKPQRTFNPQPAICKEGNAKNTERRKENDKKTMSQKAREDKTESLKRFHSNFKLPEDKDAYEVKDNVPKPDIPASPGTIVVTKHQKEKFKEEEKKVETIPETPEPLDTPKSSNLNPNAKEFVFNPNAKTFTPRGPPMAQPPMQMPSTRLQSQSPIMSMPQPHLLPGMAQTVFNVAPYLVSTTPVSVPMPQSFTPAASIAQAPRFRKAMPVAIDRNLGQPVHVQAATGQPILAQPAPQFTIQYTPSHGMLHHPPGPPQQIYTSMYPFMPRVLTPQPVGMPTSAAYGENHQIPLYMHPGTPGLQHAMTQANSGQHSAPSTPQSQTPNLHPVPSPVHQPGQPPTPTGNAPTPQPVVYHSHMASQHPLNHSSTNHPFANSYAGTPQPIVLLPQQPHPATFASSLQNHHLHGQNPGSHLPHPPIAMIPTTAAMVHSQTAISSGHYVPHSQVFS